MPNDTAVAIFQKPRIPFHPAIQERFGVTASEWRVLIDSVWPGAKSADAVMLALAYCKARRLDPFKRPVHIVPMWNSAIRQEVETVWPGISEIRTTATRTTQYAGSDPAVFGPMKSKHFEATAKNGDRLNADVTFPEWCQVTVYRMVAGQRVPFPGPRVVWEETFSQNKGLPVPNARWCRAPTQMIEKCAEAAALRRAFPEELANDLTAEEMEGKTIDDVAAKPGAVTIDQEPPITDAAEPQARGDAADAPAEASGEKAAPDDIPPAFDRRGEAAPAETLAAYKPPVIKYEAPPKRFADKYIAEVKRCGAGHEIDALGVTNGNALAFLQKASPEEFQRVVDAIGEQRDILKAA